MDNTKLKKQLNTYKLGKGSLKDVSHEMATPEKASTQKQKAEGT